MRKQKLVFQLPVWCCRFVWPMMIYLLAACASHSPTLPAQTESKDHIQTFRQKLERLLEELRIPGLSVAVVQNQHVIFADGMGYADVENRTPATANTPYNIASLTKTFSAAVLMKLVEEDQLELDEEMAEVLKDSDFPYGRNRVHGYANACEKIKEMSKMKYRWAPLFRNYRCDSEKITVRHHLTHTAQGVPGEMYRYNGFLFSFLSLVAEEASGKRFDDLLVENIIRPLEMTRTIPSINDGYRQQVLDARANYYRTGFLGAYVPSSYPLKLSSSAGMVSTVLDMAKFDIAMDRNLIVSEASKEAMFTPSISNNGYPLPYGLGWFVQEHKGVQLIWHYGHAPGAYSSLILKVPNAEVTLILFANSDAASGPFNLGAGDVLRSPFAVAFINLFTSLEVKQNRIPVTGVIHHVHTPDDRFHTYIEIVISEHFTGNLPDAIDSITVSGPNGELPISIEDFTYLSQWRDFWASFPGPPETGAYRFTATSGNNSGFSRDIQFAIRQIPIPNSGTMAPAEGEKLDTKTQTFSWKAVNAEIPIYYRLEINKPGGPRVYATDRVKGMLSHTVPEGILKPGKEYMWRVRAVDSSDWIQIQNRSHSQWRRFRMGESLK
jgi:CubicO group peptidase (beta-lactamase class C family)